MVEGAPGAMLRRTGRSAGSPLLLPAGSGCGGGCPEGNIRHLLPGSRLSGRLAHRKTARARFRKFAR
jgi:hypothetical protein